MKPIAVLKRAFEIIRKTGQGYSCWIVYTYIFLCWQKFKTEWFPIPSDTFENECGVSVRSIKKFRLALENLGLIEYKRGGNGQISQYKITEAK